MLNFSNFAKSAIKLSSENHSDVSKDLSGKFEALFPTWTTVLSTVLALLIILLFLTKLVYNPVKKMHDSRKQYIQNNINSSEKQKNIAFKNVEKTNKELMNAQLKSIEIIKNAKIEAKELKKQRIILIQKEVDKIFEDSQKDIIYQKQKFEEEAKEEIINIALAAASKILEKEVDSKTNRKIIEDFIEKEKSKK